MKALVIGYGSAGQRHARILKAIGCDVAIMSGHLEGAFRSIRIALEVSKAEYAVVASATKFHWNDLRQLALHRQFDGWRGSILIEKPVFADPSHYADDGADTKVGYNLRFHPAVRALRERITDRELYTVQFHVGQWLPDWRPSRDYRQTDVNGVLRDLSHELDLMLWLCGWPKVLYALTGKATGLDIEMEDSASILCATERCPQTVVTMNYIDHSPRRWIHVNYDGGSITADLVDHVLAEVAPDGSQTTRQYHVDKDDTYRDMHLAMLNGADADLLCGLDDGLRVVNLISLIESCQRMPWERAA